MRRLLLVVPALVLVLGAACGEDSDDGDGGGNGGAAPAGESETEPTDEEQLLAFYDCMRDNGVDMPDPDPNNPGIRLDQSVTEDPDFDAAMAVCQQLLPNGGQPPEPDAEGLAALTEFTACMRDNGVDMPDPAPDGRLSIPEDADPNSTEFQAAVQACQDLLAGNPVLLGGGGR